MSKKENKKNKMPYDPYVDGCVTAIQIFEDKTKYAGVLAKLVFASNKEDVVIHWDKSEERVEYDTGIGPNTLLYDDRNKPDFEEYRNSKSKFMYDADIKHLESKFSKQELAMIVACSEGLRKEIVEILTRFEADLNKCLTSASSKISSSGISPTWALPPFGVVPNNNSNILDDIERMKFAALQLCYRIDNMLDTTEMINRVKDSLKEENNK